MSMLRLLIDQIFQSIGINNNLYSLILPICIFGAIVCRSLIIAIAKMHKSDNDLKASFDKNKTKLKIKKNKNKRNIPPP